LESLETEVKSSQKLQKLLTMPANAYSSHPSIPERIEMALRIAVPSFNESNKSAWELYDNRLLSENEMTEPVDKNLEKWPVRKMKKIS
jgi:hypothetical protein